MGSRIIVEKARKVLICFTGRTTFRSAEPKQWCREHLASLSLDTYAERKREHIQDYQTYFNASRLTFRQEMNLDNLTTPERLKRIREGHHDIGLVNLYYDFARYLLISSSREGSLPQICRESGMKNLNHVGKQIYYKHQYSDELLDGGKNRIAGITPSASGAFEAYASKGKRGGGIHVSCRGILLSSQY